MIFNYTESSCWKVIVHFITRKVKFLARVMGLFRKES